MGSGLRAGAVLVVASLFASTADAQWKDARLIAGQVGVHVAVSFIGKIIHHETPGRAIREALEEGALAGGLAHAGYCIAGRNPEWALVGKVLAQKANLTTRRSIRDEPVFDQTLLKNWELTYAFLHFEFDGKPRLEVDAINAAFSAYYLTRGAPYRFDGRRTLLSGSLVFQNDAPPQGLYGYYVPGVIWLDSSRLDNPGIWGHEITHSLQAERGSAIKDWRYSMFRFNWLVFASGVPAFLAGWPEHDNRMHEIEAKRYSGT